MNNWWMEGYTDRQLIEHMGRMQEARNFAETVKGIYSTKDAYQEDIASFDERLDAARQELKSRNERG